MSETSQRPKIEYVIFDMDGETATPILSHLVAERDPWLAVCPAMNRSTH